MRKSVFIVTLTALMFSASLWAQKIAPRCRTCGHKLTECQYKGHHPSKDSSPEKNNKPAKARPQRHSNNSSASRTIRFADGIYTGDNVQGVRQGYGTFKYNNGDVYTGTCITISAKTRERAHIIMATHTRAIGRTTPAIRAL